MQLSKDRPAARASVDLVRAMKQFVDEGGSFRDRVRATSQLVAGILHEFNTPLGALRSAIDTSRTGLARAIKLLDERPQDARRLLLQLDEVLGIARAATDRLVDTIATLAHFARVDRAEVDIVDVGQLVDTALRLAGANRNRQIAVERIVPPDLKVRCRVREIEHVLYHVIRNATEALSGRDDARLSVRVQVRRDALLEVVVEDNGPGIDDATFATLFEPTLTTKGDTVGLGLSMPTCRYIAQEHGGSLTAANRESGGARFVFTFRELPEHPTAG